MVQKLQQSKHRACSLDFTVTCDKISFIDKLNPRLNWKSRQLFSQFSSRAVDQPDNSELMAVDQTNPKILHKYVSMYME